MSRIGKLPIKIPNGVQVELKGSTLKVKGPKGELERTFHKKVVVEVIEQEIIVKPKDESTESKALHGLTRTLIANMVEGVAKGYKRVLEVVGVGYRFKTAGNKISMTLGYSHPIEYSAPKGIEFKTNEEAKNKIEVHGIDKEVVGEVAAKVRSFKKPEPYKGKGIKYENEQVKRKAGKSAAK